MLASSSAGGHGQGEGNTVLGGKKKLEELFVHADIQISPCSLKC